MKLEERKNLWEIDSFDRKTWRLLIVLRKGVRVDFCQGNNAKITTQRRFASFQSNFDSS